MVPIDRKRKEKINYLFGV